MKKNSDKRKRRRKFVLYVGAAVLLIGIFLGAKSISLNQEKKEKEQELAGLQNTYESEEERSAELIAKRAYMNTKKYIEDLAREKFGLVYDDEIIFKEKEEDE